MAGGASESVRMRPSWAARIASLAPMLSLFVFTAW
jgi:hypothetical protein